MHPSNIAPVDGGTDHGHQRVTLTVRSPIMLRLYDLIAQVARTALPVLVQGEIGSGKELVARALHDRSARTGALFRSINCAAFPPHSLESALLGQDRSAFTSAGRMGMLEKAEDGTLFLDDVGELGTHAQVALLRGIEQVPGSVRVVAATHRDVAAMVHAGLFHADLMLRLATVTLRLPPLRERVEEILPLAELFLEQARAGRGVPRLSAGARGALLAYTWPGNVRQLKDVIDRAALLSRGELIELVDLPAPIRAAEESVNPLRTSAARGFVSLPERVREFEMGIVRQAMQEAGGNQAYAARMLGVPRRTLANKVHAYGLLA